MTILQFFYFKLYYYKEIYVFIIMSRAEKIKMFNEILEDLLQQLSPKIGTTYHFYFKKYIKINAITPINNFWYYAEDLGEKIMNRDETYFTNADNHKEKVQNSDNGLDEILRLKGIYEELDKEGRNNLWDITQALFLLAKEYNDMKK